MTRRFKPDHGYGTVRQILPEFEVKTTREILVPMLRVGTVLVPLRGMLNVNRGSYSRPVPERESGPGALHKSKVMVILSPFRGLHESCQRND
jgi:hypothetical protein